MRTLELGYNPIGAKGAEALAETVKFHSKLTTLRMGWCKITKDGAYYLAVGGGSERTSSPRLRLSPFARACSTSLDFDLKVAAVGGAAAAAAAPSDWSTYPRVVSFVIRSGQWRRERLLLETGG